MLACIETEFKDFLVRDNLKKMDNPKAFCDEKYGFRFMHEITETLEKDYDYIRSKYNRRVDMFLDQTKKNTCFIRAIHDLNEVRYIEQNYDYISATIKKNNANNEIIFLEPSNYMMPSNLVKGLDLYILDIEKYSGGTNELDKLFDTIPEFVRFCELNSDEKVRKENLAFTSII